MPKTALTAHAADALMQKRAATLASPAADAAASEPAKAAERASRVGKQRIYAYVSADAHRRLKVYAIETGQPIDEMIREALDQWLKDRGAAVGALR